MTDPLHAHVSVPLRKWIQDDSDRKRFEQLTKGSNHLILLKKQSVLRKSTVAYGIIEILKHARIATNAERSSTTTTELISTDNFIAHVSKHEQTIDHPEHPWNDISGVSMISPPFVAELTEPSFISSIAENIQDRMGRYVESIITPPLPPNMTDIESGQARDKNDCHLLGMTDIESRQARDKNDCHLLGMLLYELYSGRCPRPASSLGVARGGSFWGWGGSNSGSPNRETPIVSPVKKKSRLPPRKRYRSLQDLGFPSSVSLLVQYLIDADDAYSSLDDVRSDIHLLLSDPECFLYDLEDLASQGDNMQLNIRKDKLYGREEEVSLITGAFCRVSSGTNEAIFIGGYSGCGKSVLVQSMMARVDVAGGYVLTQKVDQLTKGGPMFYVLSAFDNLCLLIKDKSSQQELVEIANKLVHDFKSDFSVLARLLPNINVVFPQLARSGSPKDANDEELMNLEEVCLTLQRFMKIVSSRLKPVMLFLDDLQWAGSTSLELIQALLTDDTKSNCFFFVGSYRDNEVNQEHPLFALLSDLDSCGVKTTQVHLRGLCRGDLNLMVSDSLRIFPHLCKPLSDIVFAKTGGNPFFALEFLKSLVDSKLLNFSLRERRWIWDESQICLLDVTDNVLYLPSEKMSSLPEKMQQCLKVVSCFGIKVDDSVVAYLTSTSQYSDLRDWLNKAVEEGCMLRSDSCFMFVHDQVVEAAYSLIADDSKSQFHYELGILLHSVSKGQDLGSVIFQVVDCINHGVPSLIEPEMHLDISKLNFSAGSKAYLQADYKTAHSYLNSALSLLPDNHWTNDHYEFSLQLFFLEAKAAYSCGDIDNAYDSLKKILEHAHCLKDKLDAYHLYVTILHNCEERDEAYTICSEVLSQLNETIPDSIDSKNMTSMIKETGDALEHISDRDLLELKEMDGVLPCALKFYTLLKCISFWKKPEMLPYFGCRVIHLSLKHGMCQDSVFGFVQYAAVICNQCKLVPDIREACRIGKAAMSLLKRFDSSEIVSKVYFCYYGFVAVHMEPLQQCTDNLRRGFEVGISSGEFATFAFYSSIHLIRTALFGGENLSSLLKEADYHLEVMARFCNKLSMPSVFAYRETISTLIDKGKSTSAPNNNVDTLEDCVSSNTAYAQRHKGTMYVNRTLQSFWMGYSSRCHHYAKKALEINVLGKQNRLMILFYAALNAFRGIKNNNGNGSQFVKVRALYTDAITALRSATELSQWNFGSKVYLLEAELNSFERNHEEAQSLYAAAITSSMSSRHVHEQGLACELAGLHYKKIDQAETALDFFNQAKKCYSRWGSQMKVESMDRHIENAMQHIENGMQISMMIPH